MVDSALGEPTKILIVDDDASVRDVIAVLLGEEGYACTAVSSAEAALDALRRTDYPLVISDVRMPGHDGFWLLERVRDHAPDTAIVMLTAFGDTEAAVECLRNGAADYLLKPPKVTELIRAIERALGRRRLELARSKYRRSLENRVREKTAELSRALRELEATYSQTLWSLVAALDAREHETGDHSQRVVRYSLAVARRLGLPERDLPDLGRGALLHDIGKIGVPDGILRKRGPLTNEEWTLMRNHTLIGERILASAPAMAPVARLVRSTHERWDGTGYPDELALEEIPLGSRVIAVCDAFVAMTQQRPWRSKMSHEDALQELRNCAGTQFDPQLVEAFCEKVFPELFLGPGTELEADANVAGARDVSGGVS
jgi:response regulator RpfG family c-di-GMP phosphodiesterase